MRAKKQTRKDSGKRTIWFKPGGEGERTAMTMKGDYKGMTQEEVEDALIEDHDFSLCYSIADGGSFIEDIAEEEDAEDSGFKWTKRYKKKHDEWGKRARADWQDYKESGEVPGYCHKLIPGFRIRHDIRPRRPQRS